MLLIPGTHGMSEVGFFSMTEMDYHGHRENRRAGESPIHHPARLYWKISASMSSSNTVPDCPAMSTGLDFPRITNDKGINV